MYDNAWDMIVAHEGNYPHMYLDTLGYVTVGVGFLIPNAQNAVLMPFVDRLSLQVSTPQQVLEDYRRVTAMPKGRLASWYSTETHTVLPDAEIRRLFDAKVAAFQHGLGLLYPGYSTFPVGPQLALLDMAWQLGVAGLSHGWPHLNRAIMANDWNTASTESERPQSSKTRNQDTASLFLSAMVGPAVNVENPA